MSKDIEMRLKIMSKDIEMRLMSKEKCFLEMYDQKMSKENFYIISIKINDQTIKFNYIV